MSVDSYSLCPCGSGKKLKFCCSDLAGEMQKIEKLVSGEQPHAALKHVEKLLEKQPERASLLDLKASIELALNDLDAAQATIQRYLVAHSDNASAFGQAAILAAAKGQTAAAVGALQEALERADRDLPQRVFEAIGSVGHALLLEGDLVAARGHLILYAGISPDENNRAIELLLRMNLQGGLPLLLRDELHLQSAPEGTPWTDEFEAATQLARRGWWQRAEADYVALIEEHGEQIPLIYNLAVVRGWLGDAAQFAAGMHNFAQLAYAEQGEPTDEAVEAEAIAQLVDPHLDEPTLETLRIVYPVSNADTAAERLASYDQAEHYQLDPASLDGEAASHPRDSYVLMDRPVPATGEGIEIQDAPNILAFLSLYGKRTDREAQIELTTDHGERFEEVTQLLKEAVGDVLGAQIASEVVSEKPAGEEALSWRWRLPDNTPPEHRRELLAERRQQAILRDWVAAPRGALSGVSPQEASEKPELLVPLLGSVLIVEQAAAHPGELELFDRLREQLNLAATSAIEPDEQAIERLPLVRLSRLKLTEASDGQLQALLNRCVLCGANLAILRIGSELIGRAEHDESLDLAAVYRQVVRAEPNPDRALEWVQQAKQWSSRVDQSIAEWMLLELELQIERGDSDGFQAAFQQLNNDHMQEPGVGEAVYRLLYSAGLLSAEDIGRLSSAAPSPEAAQGSGLWTPGGEPASAAAGEPTEKSAIWTP